MKIGTLFFVVAFFAHAMLIGMESNNNNNNKPTYDYSKLIDQFFTLPLPLQDTVLAQSDGKIIRKNGNISILKATYEHITHDNLLAENQQKLIAVEGLQKKLQSCIGGSKKVRLLFESDKSQKTTTTWKYDGPNANNTVMMVRTDEHISREERIFEDAYVTWYKYFLYKVTDATFEKEEALQSSYKEKPYKVTAFGLAYKVDRCALATEKDDGKYVSVFDIGSAVSKRTFKIHDKVDCIQRLQFLTATYLYAVSVSGILYAVDLKADTPTGIKQTFRDKEGNEMRVQDFAIDQKRPVWGALLSYDTLYLIHIPTKKFKMLGVDSQTFYKKYVGPCHIKMFDNRIGIFKYGEHEIDIQIVDFNPLLPTVAAK